MRKNLKIIIMGMAIVQALCFTACSSGEKKEETVATESVETTEEAVETTKESLETKKAVPKLRK